MDEIADPNYDEVLNLSDTGDVERDLRSSSTTRISPQRISTGW